MFHDFHLEDINLTVIDDFDSTHVKVTSYLTIVRQAADERYNNEVKNHKENGIKARIREVYNGGPSHPMAPTYADSQTPNPLHPRTVVKICLEADACVAKNVNFFKMK